MDGVSGTRSQGQGFLDQTVSRATTGGRGFFAPQSKQASATKSTRRSRTAGKKEHASAVMQKDLEMLAGEDLAQKERVTLIMARLDENRKFILSEANVLHKSIHHTLQPKSKTGERDSESTKAEPSNVQARWTSLPEGGKQGRRQQAKSLPAAVAALGPRFFEDAMVDGLVAKAKGNRTNTGPTERLLSIEAKYKKVQQDINQVVADVMALKEKPKLDKETQKRLKHARTQQSDDRSKRIISVGGSYRPSSTSPLNMTSPLAKLGFKKNFNFAMSSIVGQSINSNEKPNLINDIVTRTKSEEKDQAKFRRKIDNLYMKFAKTEKYSQLYNFSKEKLKRENKNFQIESSKPRYLPEIDDYFIVSEELRYISPNILTTPIINTFLATNAKKYQPKKDENSSEDEELVNLV
jgi:hypothetical protein